MSRSPDIYARAVNGGSGDGAYTNGTAVPITADASAAHYKFDRWIGDTNTVADVFAAYETSVSGSGTVTFWWRVSSESDADYLKFLVDGTQIVAISGTKGPWAQVSQRIEGAGVSHTLRWEYAKNGSLASSTDAGWVDDIVWTGDVPEPVLAPDIQTAAVTNGVLGIRFLGERGIPYTVYSNATLQASGWALMQPVPQEEGEIKGEAS